MTLKSAGILTGSQRTDGEMGKSIRPMLLLFEAVVLTRMFSVWGRALSSLNHKLTGAPWRPYQDWREGLGPKKIEVRNVRRE